MQGGFPVTSKQRIFALERVKPGLKGVGYTIFSGAKPEAFGVEVLGVMPGHLGPGNDLILARLSGAKIEKYGVISGMSGSPVFIEDRLVGAVSYRFGVFAKEPIAGITPIGSMLKIGRSAARGAKADLGLSIGSHRPEPIALPLMVGGMSASVLQTLEDAGHQVFRLGDGRRVPGIEASPIAPAGPVGVCLMRGDVSAWGVGTVTFVEEDRVLGFGHSFSGRGKVDIPMSRAAVLNSLASALGSFKQAIPGPVVGAVTEDRLWGIEGTLGLESVMIPVRTTVDEKHRVQVEIVNDAQWFPSMLRAAILTAGVDTPGYEAKGTVYGRMTMNVQGRSITLERYGSAPHPTDAVRPVARTLAYAAARVMKNPWSVPEVRSVTVSLKRSAEEEVWTLVGLSPSRTSVRAGETLEVTALLKPYRGALVRRRLKIALPAGRVGSVSLHVGGGRALDAMEAQSSARSSPESLSGMLDQLSAQRPVKGLFARLSWAAGGVRQGELEFERAPPSMRATLLSQTAMGAQRVSVALGASAKVPLEHPVEGLMSLRFEVR